MPKKAFDYGNTEIYKIIHVDPDINLTYVGHTITLPQLLATRSPSRVQLEAAPGHVVVRMTHSMSTTNENHTNEHKFTPRPGIWV